jgi:beta-glucosidase
MSQAYSLQQILDHDSTMQAGTSIYALPCYPASDSAKDIAAAERGNAAWKLFIDPHFGKAYPLELLPALKRIEDFIQTDDLKQLATPPDFIGINYYFRAVLRHNAFVPITRASFLTTDDEKTDNGWDIYPQGLHDVLMDFSSYPVDALYITENGSAYNDTVANDRIHDEKRRTYLQQHLQQLLAVRQKTKKLKGYFAWSLFDNFEWSDGYDTRFGLYHINFATQQRRLKDSGRWYRDFLASSS